MGLARLIALSSVLTLAAACPALAADMAGMPEIPQIEVGDQTEPELGTNWYLRGDIGYAWTNIGVNADFPAGAALNSERSDNTWTVGGGVGYDFGWVRTDLTVDYFNDFSVNGSTAGTECADGVQPLGACSSSEESEVNALPILFNLYFDLGTWGGLTPYVGAGAGAALVQWDNWRTVETCDDAGCIAPYAGAGEIAFSNSGEKEWKFTYALMAGFSYALNQNLSLDFGYRFTAIDDGKAVPDYVYQPTGASLGSIDFEDFYNHEVRVGFRYTID